MLGNSHMGTLPVKPCKHAYTIFQTEFISMSLQWARLGAAGLGEPISKRPQTIVVQRSATSGSPSQTPAASTDVASSWDACHYSDHVTYTNGKYYLSIFVCLDRGRSVGRSDHTVQAAGRKPMVCGPSKTRIYRLLGREESVNPYDVSYGDTLAGTTSPFTTWFTEFDYTAHQDLGCKTKLCLDETIGKIQSSHLGAVSNHAVRVQYVCAISHHPPQLWQYKNMEGRAGRWVYLPTSHAVRV